MGATAYHIAVIEQSSVVRRSFNWITSYRKPFVEYDAVDIDDGLISAVYELYRHVYGKLGGTLYINDKYALLKYTRWVITVDKTGQVTGFMLSREHPCGIKLGLTAAADSKEAKAAPMLFPELKPKMHPSYQSILICFIKKNKTIFRMVDKI